MPSQRPGRGLMTAGVIVIAAGLLVVAVREFHIPRAWIPVIVGIALLVAGIVRWLMAGRDPETPSGPPSASR